MVRRAYTYRECFTGLTGTFVGTFAAGCRRALFAVSIGRGAVSVRPRKEEYMGIVRPVPALVGNTVPPVLVIFAMFFPGITRNGPHFTTELGGTGRVPWIAGC